MEIEQMFAVAGNPILHSKSPMLFRQLFDKDYSGNIYSRIAVDDVDELLFLAKEIGFSGLNITSPFKQTIIQYLDEIEDSTKKINSVNTVKNVNGKLIGYNSDSFGCVKSLINNAVKIDGCRCLVIGAGGAARAAVYGLVAVGASVTIFNRTYDKAVALANEFHSHSDRLENINTHLQNSDIIVSIYGSADIGLNLSNANKNLVALDAAYKNSNLKRQASDQGLKYIPGEEWLYYQGLESYKIFTGQEVDFPFEKAVLHETPLYQNTDNIVLIGFTGSGKTTVGAALARKLNFDFIDIDSLIEQEEQRTIKEIFDVEGQEYFRKKETEILTRLENNKRCLISCGGGIVIEEENLNLLKKLGIVVWLYSPLDLCLQKTNIDLKPLLSDGKANFRGQYMFEARKLMYCACSDLIVNSTKTIEEIVNKIQNEYNIFLSSK